MMSASLDRLAEIRADATRCTACPLYKTATTTVIYRGNPHPVVLFVGQSPGEEEDKLGVPFVGRSGRELDAKLHEAPFPDYGITNAVLHRPPGNKYDRDYGVACRPFLERTIKALRPRALVTLGNDAFVSVNSLEIDIPKFGMRHPAAMLHNPNYRAEWDDGWVKLRMWLGAKGLGVST